MTNGKFDDLFGGPPRKPETLLTQRDMDLARSIQEVTEEVVLRLVRSLASRDRCREPLSGGRSGVELRGQWTNSSRRSFQGAMDPTLCRRRRWSRRRGAHRVAQTGGQAA